MSIYLTIDQCPRHKTFFAVCSEGGYAVDKVCSSQR